jgi:hypothetical protein
LLYPGRKTLEELSRWSPAALTSWRLRRIVKAGYWSIHVLVEWLANDVIATLPPPENGVLFEIGDSSHVPKRGTKATTAQRSRKSKYHPWFFGIRFVLLIVAWDVYRIPVAFRIILPKTHPDYRTENALFRDMLQAFIPLEWTTWTVVLGDAAYGSKANINLIKQLEKTDRCRHWAFGFAISRTWKTIEDKAVKALVTHLPRHHYKRDQMEKSFGMAVLAYLFIVRLTHHEIIPSKPWSLTQLQHGLRLKVFTNQVEHNLKAKLGRGRKAANTSA